MKRWLIEKLGGYVTIEDALVAVKDLSLDERTKILTAAVRKHFNTIGPDDILKELQDGRWQYKGKTLSDGERRMLVAEATAFLDTKLWEILQTDIKYQSNKKMFILGKTEIDFIAGKLWLFSLDATNTRLKSMRRNNGSFNSTV